MELSMIHSLKMKNMTNYLLAFCVLLLTSCASSLFSVDKNSDITNINTTVGDELVDLKKALDAGAITEEEYNEMKRQILERDKK